MNFMLDKKCFDSAQHNFYTLEILSLIKFLRLK